MTSRSAFARVVDARAAYALVGVLSVGAAWSIEGWSWTMLLAGLAPDIPLLAGAGANRGQLSPRAVPWYNATHRMTGPVLCLLGGTAGLTVSPWLLVVGFTWSAHILLDRAAGYGLRDPNGWPRGATASTRGDRPGRRAW